MDLPPLSKGNTVRIVVLVFFLLFVLGIIGYFAGPRIFNRSEIGERTARVVATKDVAGCEAIADETYRKICINNIVLKLAEETKDTSYCDKLDGEMVKPDDCKIQLVAASLKEANDPSACNTIIDEDRRTVCIASFYIQKALSEKNAAACGQLTKEMQNYCKEAVSLLGTISLGTLKDFSCDTLKDPALKADCVNIKRAFLTPKPTAQVCQAVRTPYFAELCRTTRL